MSFHDEITNVSPKRGSPRPRGWKLASVVVLTLSLSFGAAHLIIKKIIQTQSQTIKTTVVSDCENAAKLCADLTVVVATQQRAVLDATSKCSHLNEYCRGAERPKRAASEVPAKIQMNDF